MKKTFKVGHKFKVKNRYLVWLVGSIVEITKIRFPDYHMKQIAIDGQIPKRKAYTSEVTSLAIYFYDICQEYLKETCPSFRKKI